MNEPTYSDQQLSLLESLGFKEYDPSNELHWQHDIIDNSYGKVFIEEHLSRQRIYITIMEFEDEDEYECFEIYVLRDVGCETIRMPFSWSELSADWLTHLKISLCGHGFIKDGKEVKIHTNEEQP